MSKASVLRVFISESLAAASREILAAVDKVVAGYEEEALGLRRELDRQREQLELLQLLHPPDYTGRGQNITGNQRHEKVERESLDQTKHNQNMRHFDPEMQWERGSSEAQNHVDLKIRIIEDTTTDVLSNDVLKNCPVLNLQSPGGLSESEFLLLLRSKFPQLDRNLPFEVCTSDRRKRLQPLRLNKLTAEEISGRIGKDKAMIFIRLKRIDGPLECVAAESVENSPTTTSVLGMAEINNSSPIDVDHMFDGSAAEQTCGAMTLEKDGILGQVEDNSTEKSEKDVNDEKETRINKKVLVVSDDEWEPASKAHRGKVRMKKAKKQKRTDPNVLFCKICNAFQNSEVEFIKHVHSHAADPGGLCSVCGETTQSLVDHLHCFHKTLVCHICGDSFHFKNSFDEHVASHSGEKSHKCHVCNAEFALEESLNHHRTLHEADSAHKCSICQEVFALKEELQAHRRTHAVTKLHQCGVCGKSLSDYRSLSRHKMTHTAERPHSCHVCGRRFKLIGTLRTHEKIHTNRERSFLCDVCCKMFLTSKQLQIHMRQHTNEKPYQCSKCGKDFATRGALTVHMRVHTGEKPYPCPYCGCAFKRKSNLDEHVTVHSGIKPFVCGICGKACARKTHLTVHMRTHNGEKPYKCNVCDKGFTQSHCLKTHRKTHQMSEPTD
ncbi:zinc finger protein 260-like [Synchiropus splendidus]|uniref:zinc finger protein 260-like n=1 Tax=Synchiropus splendidus TaxID=270530 RepID=UPI00237E800D|nr:zinc finger protein 260-like [Synchiropus splendidus]